MLEGAPPEGDAGMMFVEPSAIGQGVGRLLFEHNLARGRELGFTRFRIDADPNAESFYRKMGAVRVGNAPSGSVPGGTPPQLTVAVTSRGALSRSSPAR